MYWFTSDTHFGHTNAIEYNNRPFSSLIEMEDKIIDNINSRVDENDTLFILGDFCMKKSSEASEAPQKAFDYYRNKIKCKNVIFIRGNHDENNGTHTIIESVVIDHGGNRIFMTHNPKWARDDLKFNFCGHLHGKDGVFKRLGKKSVVVDVGVECWEYRPVDINEINQAYSIWLKGGKK